MVRAPIIRPAAILLALGSCLPVSAGTQGPLEVAHVKEVALPSEPVAVAVRPGSGELWVSMQDGSLGVVDPGSLEVVGSVPDIGTGAWGLAFHPDGRTLYRTSWLANELVVVDAEVREIRGRIQVGLKPAFLQVSHDGRRAWVSNFFSGELSIVDLEKWTTIRDLDVGRRPMGLAVGPLGRYAFISSGVARVLKVVDLSKQEIVQIREIDFAGTHNLELRLEGVQLLAAGWPDLLLTVDLEDPETEVRRIKVGRDPVGVALDPSERYAFVTNYRDSTVSVVDLEAGEQVETHPTAEGPMFLSVDGEAGRLYVCAGKGKALSVFSIGGAAPPAAPAKAASAAGAASLLPAGGD